jgi:hypothetical protein
MGFKLLITGLNFVFEISMSRPCAFEVLPTIAIQFILADDIRKNFEVMKKFRLKIIVCHTAVAYSIGNPLAGTKQQNQYPT